MTKFTHTPGPWKAYRYPTIDGGYGFEIMNSGSATIANLSPGKTTDRIEEVAALNAELIASAPRLLDENANLRIINADLIAALEAIKGIAAEGVLSRSCTGQPTWTAFGAIKEIIAKAKGE